jgi:Uri superfamily endonuclease
MNEKGAYLLLLSLKKSVCLKPGALKRVSLPAGEYIYVGSARGGIGRRIARYLRMADTKKGNLHWHIDYLLVRPDARIAGFQPLAGKNECAVSKRIASRKGVSVPAPGFGSSDCRSGCKAHFYSVEKPDFIQGDTKWIRLPSNSIGKEKKDISMLFS